MAGGEHWAKELLAESYDIVLRISQEEDIAVARTMAKRFAQEAGFSLADVTKIATSVSELARNIYRYAGEGKVFIRKKDVKGVPALEVVAFDEGPGIEDVEVVLLEGYSTLERSLGIGLTGVKKLMDKFEIYSLVGKGTLVRVEKRRRGF